MIEWCAPIFPAVAQPLIIGRMMADFPNLAAERTLAKCRGNAETTVACVESGKLKQSRWINLMKRHI